MSQIRVLLVDDSDVFLNVEERWLSKDPRVQIVGRAHSGQEAVEHVSRLSPDLVLMDLNIPDMNGLEAARKIKAKPGAPRIVLLTVEINEEFKTAAEAIKVDGFLAKAQMSTDLLPLLQTLFPDSKGKRARKVTKRSKKRGSR
jgi:DNA-binding NarL/FixJ family response regulator